MAALGIETTRTSGATRRPATEKSERRRGAPDLRREELPFTGM